MMTYYFLISSICLGLPQKQHEHKSFHLQRNTEQTESYPLIEWQCLELFLTQSNGLINISE